MNEQECYEAFNEAMKGRQYGEQETADAFAWFRAGWLANGQETGLQDAGNTMPGDGKDILQFRSDEKKE